MPKLTPRFQLQTNSGDAVTIGDTTITPQSRMVIVRWPSGGFVWNRPIAVLIDRAGQTERRPIVDVTRYATWTLSLLTFVFSVIILKSAARRR